MLALALVWYLVVGFGGAAGFVVLRRLGFGDGAAAAAGRVVGWSFAGYAGWLAGLLGLAEWWLVALAATVAAWVLLRAHWRGVSLRPIGEVELIGAATFVVLAALRFPAMAVTATEKPMDLAILATLLRGGALPPGDPWLSGTALPYYYWGFVPWIAPARLLGLNPDVVFNLLVVTLAAVTAQAAWA
ncbi:MAG: DUF2298 domain-containing protein, partial [Acidobacteriota bacterium]